MKYVWALIFGVSGAMPSYFKDDTTGMFVMFVFWAIVGFLLAKWLLRRRG